MLVTATATPSSHAFQTCSSNSPPDRRASLAGRTVGDVPGPHPVRMLNRELAIEGVLCHGQPVIRLSGGSPLLHGLGPDPFDAHEPRDAVLADTVPPLDQGVPDAGTAVGLTGLPVDHPDGRARCGWTPPGGSQAVSATRNSPQARP